MQKQRQRREGRRSAQIGCGDDGGVPVDRHVGHLEGLADLVGALSLRARRSVMATRFQRVYLFAIPVRAWAQDRRQRGRRAATE